MRKFGHVESLRKATMGEKNITMGEKDITRGKVNSWWRAGSGRWAYGNRKVGSYSMCSCDASMQHSHHAHIAIWRLCPVATLYCP